MGKIDPITSPETFKIAFNGALDHASELFTKDGHLVHAVFPIDENGLIHTVSFDSLMDAASEMSGSKNDDILKGICYETIARGMVILEAVGYIEAAEVWTISQNPGASFRSLIERHGVSLGDVPGREEAILVCGRWRDVTLMSRRKIRRMGDIVALGEVESYDKYEPGRGRQRHLWEAIDKVTGSDLTRSKTKKVDGIDGGITGPPTQGRF